MNKISFLLIVVTVPGMAVAQEVTQPAFADLAMRKVVLAPNTEVVVTPNDTVTTKGSEVKEGFKFRFATVLDVMQDGYVVIPKGTPGLGTVTWMTNKGAFGKSGKMEVSFDWLDLGGRRVALTGSHRQEGEGNTGATVGAFVAVGVFSAFVTGRSAAIVNGQPLRARVAEPLTFHIPANAPQMIAGTLAAAPRAATPTQSLAVATPATAPKVATLTQGIATSTAAATPTATKPMERSAVAMQAAAMPVVATPVQRPVIAMRVAALPKYVQLVPEGTIPPAVIDIPVATR